MTHVCCLPNLKSLTPVILFIFSNSWLEFWLPRWGNKGQIYPPVWNNNNKTDKIHETTVFRTFGHWATKDSDTYETEKNWASPTNPSANEPKGVSRCIDGQYQNQTDFILYSWRWRSPIQSVKTRPGADCDSDHQLLIAKFRLKLKKVGKTTRPFGYDLNQIPYDYTVEVTNRVKGLDLVDRVPEELWTEVYNTVWEVETKTIPQEKKKMQEAKMVVQGGLTNSWGKKKSERKRRNGKIHPSECRVPEKSKES